MITFQRIQYALKNFRTKKTYIFFLLVQLLLALVIVPVALSCPSHFRSTSVILLELLLFLLLAFDLVMVRWITQQDKFCKSKSNIFDGGILCLFAATLLFLLVYGQGEGKDYRNLIETDDILIIVIVISRYIIQVTRLFCEIRRVKANRKLQSQMKQVNLNALDLTHNNSLNFQDLHKVDQVLRNKIGKRQQLVEEEG